MNPRMEIREDKRQTYRKRKLLEILRICERRCPISRVQLIGWIIHDTGLSIGTVRDDYYRTLIAVGFIREEHDSETGFYKIILTDEGKKELEDTRNTEESGDENANL